MTTRTRIITTADKLDWTTSDGSVEFTFATDELHPSLERIVLQYGLKQILSDAGAVSKGTDDGERHARMEKRARALREGTWAFRDGTATETPETDSALMYTALVAARTIVDTPDVRALWKSLKPSERRATLNAAGAAAKEHYERSRPAARADGALILDQLHATASLGRALDKALTE